MKENMVKLSEVLEKIKGFIDGIYTQEDLDNWCSCIEFYPKLTTREKYNKIDDIIHNKEYSTDVFESFIELEMNKFWYGLLGYTNIDISETELLTEENYDILNVFFTDWALGYIEKDYEKFLRLFDSLWTYNSMVATNQTLIDALFTINQENQATDMDFISYLKDNPETLKDLAQIAVGNSPITIPDIDYNKQ